MKAQREAEKAPKIKEKGKREDEEVR